MANDLSYNWIYKALVNGPNDVHGAVAYVLYKNEKIAYIEHFTKEKGRQPDGNDLAEFHRMTNLPGRLESYREQADRLLEEFLEAMLAARVQVEQDAFRQSHVSTMIRDTEADIRAHIQSSESVIKAEVSKVQRALDGGKGMTGWFKDLGSNLLVNLLTVVLIGLAVVGSAHLDDGLAVLKSSISSSK
jgi:hypothetical protein